MRKDEVRGTTAYCVFPSRAGSLAGGGDAREGGKDADRLARLPLCPRPVAALGFYRGGILPVVQLDADASGGDGAPGARPLAVLVLRAAPGPLGLLIDRGGLAVVEHPAGPGAGVRGGATSLPEGLVAAGSLDRGGEPCAVLDVDRTWSAMRGLVERGYGAGRAGGLGPVSQRAFARIMDGPGSIDGGRQP